MRIVLDTSVLVRAHGGANGLARDLLLALIESEHKLVVSNELLYELARVLRYPRMMSQHGQSEEEIYHYVGRLRERADVVLPDPLLFTPVRDINDIIVLQTAIVGGADVLCTRDRDFFEPPAIQFLHRAHVEVMSDVDLMHRIRV